MFDFQIRYTHCKADAFIDQWPDLNTKLYAVLDKFYKTQVFETVWSRNVNALFILMKLLPPKNNKAADVFLKATDNLITFRSVIDKILKIISSVLLICLNFSAWYRTNCNDG